MSISQIPCSLFGPKLHNCNHANIYIQLLQAMLATYRFPFRFFFCKYSYACQYPLINYPDQRGPFVAPCYTECQRKSRSCKKEGPDQINKKVRRSSLYLIILVYIIGLRVLSLWVKMSKIFNVFPIWNWLLGSSTFGWLNNYCRGGAAVYLWTGIEPCILGFLSVTGDYQWGIPFYLFMLKNKRSIKVG